MMEYFKPNSFAMINKQDLEAENAALKKKWKRWN